MCASAVSFETLYTSWKDEVHKIVESDEQSKRVEQSKKEQKCIVINIITYYYL